MSEEIINGNATENSGSNENNQAERTFTQAEVDKIIDKRLKREREGMPTPEELTKYREWQKAQETEADKISALMSFISNSQLKFPDCERFDLSALISKHPRPAGTIHQRGFATHLPRRSGVPAFGQIQSLILNR